MRPKRHAHTWRDRAFKRGIGSAGAITAAAYGILALVLFEGEVFRSSPLLALHILVLGPGTALLIVGALFMRRAHRLDDRSHMVAAATPLPARLVIEDDHAWISGEICVPEPLRAPHFDRDCAWYDLAEYRQAETGGRDQWRKVRETRRSTASWLEDDGAGVRITFDDSVKDGLPEKVRHQGGTRYRLRFVPATGGLSVCGRVVPWDGSSPESEEEPPPPKSPPADDALRAPEGSRAWQRSRDRAARARGESTVDGRPIVTPPDTRWIVTASDTIPLVITPVSRNEWVDRAEASESEHLVSATIQLFFGLGTAAWAILVFLLGAAPGAGLTFLISAAASLTVLAVAGTIALRNRFVLVRQRTKHAWARFEADRKLRHDLIPNLVETVKAHAQLEQETFRRVVEARKAAVAITDDIEAENRAGELTRSLMAVTEKYPELKAHEAFTKLMDRLTAVEDKLAHGRSFFNEVIEEYNTLVTSLPNLLFARPFGFRPLPFWRL